MKDFKDKVAVITGAGTGIGKALAFHCAEKGMKVVLGDVNAKAIGRHERKLKKMGVEVISVPTDVSKYEAVEALAQKAYDTFGAIHLLFNNAGVQILGPSIWEHTIADWEWIMGVNLWGCIYGVKAFVPRMLEQDEECHIINTASIMGILPGGGIYGVTKHGIVSLSESLRLDLRRKKSKIKVSVVCPGFVSTYIGSEKCRPEELKNPPNEINAAKQTLETGERYKKVQSSAPRISPEEAAEVIFKGIMEETFYLFTPLGEIQVTPIQKRFNYINDALKGCYE